MALAGVSVPVGRPRVLANVAYTLLYEQTLAYWAANASPDAHGHMPDPLDLLDQAVS